MSRLEWEGCRIGLGATALAVCLGCGHPRPDLNATAPAPSILTPISPEVAKATTWFDDIEAAGVRDPRLRRDSIRAGTQRRVAELRWMEGRWTQHYRLLASPNHDEYRDDRAASVAISRGGLWLVVRDSGVRVDVVHYLTFDPAASQWKRLEVGLPTYASLAGTTSDWSGGQIVFEYTMALTSYIGHPLSQRERWRRINDNEWIVTEEQRLADGQYVLIEEMRYTRDK
jgi:hypothetical protein